VEPGSFEHCKAATISFHYARDIIGNGSSMCHRRKEEMMRVVAKRYGHGNEAYNSHILEELNLAIENPGGAEWLL